MVGATRTVDSVPSLPGLPLFGQLIPFRFRRLQLLSDAARLGPMSRLKLGPLNVLMLTDATLARELLVDHAEDFTKSRTLAQSARLLLGEGLLTSEHEVHRRQRKLLAALFSPREVAVWADQMVQETDAAVTSWRGREEMDVGDEMMKLTLSIVGRTLFDVDVSAEAEWVGRGLTEANHQTMVESTRLLPLPMRIPTIGRLRNRAALRRLDEFAYRLIAERRASGASGSDVLSLLVRARDEDDGRTMTDREIRDEVMSLFFAGHETTATLLTWTWALLAEAPAVRSRLEAELAQVHGGRRPTFADLPSLPYAAQVLDETMRLYPPVYGLGRLAERDVVLGGVTVPKGWTVAVNIYGMHHDARLFPDPERFDPDRMTAERREALPRSAYMPFGAGSRVCIGSHFAVMEAHLLLATIAQRVRLDRVVQRRPRMRPLITLRPEQLPMRIAAWSPGPASS